MAYLPLRATEETDILRNRVINVESLNAFPEPVNNIITLRNQTTYILTKPIDLGINQLEIPSAGSVSIVSSNAFVNNITTDITGNTPLIIGGPQRLRAVEINFTSTTGTSVFIDTDTTPSAVPSSVLVRRSFITNFASIGKIKGAVSLCDNVIFVNNAAGIILEDNGLIQGTGIVWNTVSFINQSGTHITATGTSDFLAFNEIIGAPSTGDQIYDLSGLTVTGTAEIGLTLFNDANGGTTGLIQTIDTDTTLENIFNEIEVDTSSNVVEVTLPDTTASSIQTGFPIYITDLGNAGTNNITVTVNSNDTMKLNLSTSFVMDVDDQSIIINRVDDQWIIIGDSKNTGVAASIGFTGGATSTVLADTTTFVKIAGTYVEGNLLEFTSSLGTLTYTGGNPILKTVTAVIELLLVPEIETDQIEISLFVNGSEITKSRKQHTLDAVFQTPTSPIFYVQENVPLNQDDEIEVRMRNVSNATNITVTDVKLVVGE